MTSGNANKNSSKTNKTNSNNNKLIRRRIAPTQVYKPSVYRYTCHGAFFLSSENQGSEGICRGFKSRLELLADLDHNSRVGAIRDFTYMTDYDLDDSEAGVADRLEPIEVSPALIYPEAYSKDLLPEEEVIKKQEWACYGSTEVEYLVLRDSNTGSEKIAAVAPRNNFHSVRIIRMDKHSITNIGLGALSLQFISEKISYDKEKRKLDEEKRKLEWAEGNLPKLNLSNLPPPKESLATLFNFSAKVASHTKANMVWLYHQFNDDFFSRSVTAGENIVSQIPTRVEKTGAFAGKLIRRFMGSDDDDDDDDED